MPEHPVELIYALDKRPPGPRGHLYLRSRSVAAEPTDTISLERLPSDRLQKSGNRSFDMEAADL
jgi:hypothetical protein